MSVTELRTMTVQEAIRAVGKWVAVLPGARPAIIIKATGTSVLVRLCDPKGAYITTGPSGLVRRTDWDGNPDPWWLRQARNSSRPARDLLPLLFPGEHAIAADVVDELTYRSYRQQRRLRPEDDYRRWGAIFDNVDALEARLREEQSLAHDLDDRVRQDARRPVAPWGLEP